MRMFLSFSSGSFVLQRHGRKGVLLFAGPGHQYILVRGQKGLINDVEMRYPELYDKRID